MAWRVKTWVSTLGFGFVEALYDHQLVPLSSMTLIATLFCSPAVNGSLTVPARCSHTESS